MWRLSISIVDFALFFFVFAFNKRIKRSIQLFVFISFQCEAHDFFHF